MIFRLRLENVLYTMKTLDGTVLGMQINVQQYYLSNIQLFVNVILMEHLVCSTHEAYDTWYIYLSILLVCVCSFFSSNLLTSQHSTVILNFLMRSLLTLLKLLTILICVSILCMYLICYWGSYLNLFSCCCWNVWATSLWSGIWLDLGDKIYWLCCIHFDAVGFHHGGFYQPFPMGYVSCHALQFGFLHFCSLSLYVCCGKFHH